MMNRTASMVVLLSALLLLWRVRQYTVRPVEVEAREALTSVEPQRVENQTKDWQPHSPRGELGFPRADLLMAAEAENDPERRSELLSSAADSIPQGEFGSALNALIGLNTPVAAELRQQIVRQWAEGWPRAAAAWAAQLPEGPVAVEAATQIAIAWANNDLSAAAAWSASLPEGAARSEALLNVAYEAARVQPLTAMEVALKVPASAERDKLLLFATTQWASVDAAAASSWAATVPDIELRQRLLGATSIGLAGQNAAAAANLAANALPPGDEQNQAIVAIVERWAEDSPRNAASWILQFPDTPVRQVAVENLVQLWSAEDNPGVANWLRTLPESSLRKAGWNAYTQSMQLLGSARSSSPDMLPTETPPGLQTN